MEFCPELKCYQYQPCRAHAAARFWNWLGMHGAELKNAELRDTWYGRGLFATRDLPAGSIVVTVPRKLLFTQDAGFGPDEIPKWEAACQALKSTVHADHLAPLRLVVSLLRQTSVSFWEPYLTMLPTTSDFAYHPLTWSDEQKAGLEGTSQITLLDELMRQVKDFYVQVNAAFGEHTWEHFFWAFLVVHTRPAHVPINGRIHEVIIPLGDMINHSPKRNTDWGFDDKSNHVFVKAGPDGIRADEEVFICYSDNGLQSHSADWWFRSYGFIPEENEAYDVLYLYLGIVPGDPMFGAKYSRLSGTPSSLFRLSMDCNNVFTRRLFSFARFKFQTSLEPSSESRKAAELDIEPISVENELQVLLFLRDRCTSALDGFATSLQQDREALNSPVDLVTRGCLEMRICDKVVAHHYVSLPELVVQKSSGQPLKSGSPFHEAMFESYYQTVWSKLEHHRAAEVWSRIAEG